MKLNKILFIPLIGLSLTLTACPFFGEDDEWLKSFGTPELLLENARDEAYVYLYDEDRQFKDTDNVIKEALKEAAPYEKNESHSKPKDLLYFTYEAKWQAATTGPNYEHLSIWENGFVRIDHKTSLGPHKYLYFSITEETASSLVVLAFSLCEEAHGNHL